MNTLDIAAPQDNVAEGTSTTWGDWLGIVASVGCAIHCAAMPFVFAYLPALGLSFLADEAFHKWMALFCFLIAIVAFVPGLFKHGSWIPVSIGSVGLVLITVAAFGLAGECCSSCSQEATVATHVESEASCCDEDCEHCESAQSGTGDANTDSTIGSLVADKSSKNQASFLSLFAPWITPIGGVLLVTAHLLNRRYGCLCSCCKSEPEIVPAPKTI